VKRTLHRSILGEIGNLVEKVKVETTGMTENSKTSKENAKICKEFKRIEFKRSG